MPLHAGILRPRAVAVITGGASGIGLAAAKHFAAQGMSLVLVDVSADLDSAVEQVKAVEGVAQVLGVRADVSRVDDVVRVRDRVLDEFGEIHVLMANAGISRPCPAFSFTRALADVQADWAAVLATNLGGVVNTAQVFAPVMARQENDGAMIVTGSKQGITCPPGNAGYNVSKAAVKCFTEQLAHDLRTSGTSCTAHLFVPGWVHTGLTGAKNGGPKPAGAWTPEQTVEYMVDKVFNEGDFYVICPDNETNSTLDKARIEWSLGDVLQNRPALSRWHPEWKARFEEFISGRKGLAARSRSRGRPMDPVPL
ncbi:hypothetical protein Q5752_002557 [Cryptotrichosporon argae]